MYGAIVTEIPRTCRECRFFAQSYGYLCLGEEVTSDSHISWLKENYAAARPEWCPIEKVAAVKQDVMDIIQDEIDSVQHNFPFTHDDDVKLNVLTDLLSLVGSIVKDSNEERVSPND